jgi:hypothetical protein
MLQEILPQRPQTKENYVENIRILCIESPKKTIVIRSLQLDVPKTINKTVKNICLKNSNLK